MDNFLLDGDKIFYRIGLVVFEEVYNVHKNKGIRALLHISEILREKLLMRNTDCCT